MMAGGQGIGGMATLPVNVFETPGGLMVVAPMPGIGSDDISLMVTEDSLVLESTQRGPGQDDRTYLQHEWSYGPYSRTLPLPMPVSAATANATLGNGVLTVSLLRAAKTEAGPITLHSMGPAHGQAIGHAGHNRPA